MSDVKFTSVKLLHSRHIATYMEAINLTHFSLVTPISTKSAGLDQLNSAEVRVSYPRILRCKVASVNSCCFQLF
jgi:hypothetical protein